MEVACYSWGETISNRIRYGVISTGGDITIRAKKGKKNKRPTNPYSNFFRRNRSQNSNYKDELKFSIEMADPSPEQRAIASIYDELLPVVERIGKGAEV